MDIPRAPVLEVVHTYWFASTVVDTSQCVPGWYELCIRDAPSHPLSATPLTPVHYTNKQVQSTYCGSVSIMMVMSASVNPK
jgi:hypothetical protein